MSYFAAVLARRSSGWSGEEIELATADDLDGVVDLMRSSTEDDASTLLLLVEENDEWFGVVRIDDDGDPRVFVSDGRVVETSSIGAVLGEAAAVELDLDEDEDDEQGDGEDEDSDERTGLVGEPVGDPDILADLGTPSPRLLQLCSEEGQLPGDILTALCETAGCVDALEALRGA